MRRLLCLTLSGRHGSRFSTSTTVTNTFVTAVISKYYVSAGAFHNLFRQMSSNSPQHTATTWTANVDKKSGAFKRPDSAFRDHITAAGPYTAVAGRYHLYVSLACPWAHRTLIVRELKQLQAAIDVTVVDWLLVAGVGWTFTDRVDKCSADPVHHFERLRQIYELNQANYDGRVTVPVLFDKEMNRIVNNESAEIIRMLNSEFNTLCASKEAAALDLYPNDLRSVIDEINEWVYPNINNGVYRTGFATTQDAYNTAVKDVFTALDKCEEILSKQRYIASNTQLTEADVRLFTTLIRFDPVYHYHFKCNIKKLTDYPNIHAYTRELYQNPNFHGTVDFHHIKHHYFESHKHINPTGIVPEGPSLTVFDEPHHRDKLKNNKL